MKDYWKGLSIGGKIKVVFYSILVIATLIFAVVNWEKTTLNLVFIEVMIPKSILILLAMAAGFGLAKLSDMKKIRTLERDYRILQKSIVSEKSKLVKEESTKTND